jgi:hypothetical protein
MAREQIFSGGFLIGKIQVRCKMDEEVEDCTLIKRCSGSDVNGEGRE